MRKMRGFQNFVESQLNNLGVRGFFKVRNRALGLGPDDHWVQNLVKPSPPL
jgi:hypothetical protein